VVSVSSPFCLWIYNYIIKRQLEKRIRKWKVIDQIMYILSLVLTITILNFLYFTYILNLHRFHIDLLLYVIYYTFVIGLLPTLFMVIFEYNQYLRGKLHAVMGRETRTENKILTFPTHLVKEKEFTIELNDFLYAEVDRNKVIIHFIKEGRAESKTFRSSLSSILEILDHPNIFRCHRSFVVNLNRIESARGNSNGYQLNLINYSGSIPVSRSYVEEFRNIIH